MPSATATSPTAVDPSGRTLVNFAGYNARGENSTTTDAAGVVTKTTFDDMGRTTSVTQNYQSGGITPSTPSDGNLTTQYLYASNTGVSSVSQLEPNSSSTSVSLGSTVYDLDDDTSDSYYLMYSANSSDTSQSDTADFTGTGSVVAVRYQNGWQYCQGVSWETDTNSSGQYVSATPDWVSFVPRPDDVLIAAINYSSGVTTTGSGSVTYMSMHPINSITTLSGDTGTLDGIQYGYASSSSLSISFTSNLATLNPNGGDPQVVGYHPDYIIVSGSIVPNAVAQVTSYVYGSLAGDSSGQYMPTDVVRAVVYPGSFYSSQSGGFSGADYATYDYDQVGEMTSMTDQNHTTHNYDYDGVGRLLSDSVTFATGNPANLDESVASIDYAYKACGRLLSVTSENSSNVALNEVYFHYDTAGLVDEEYQEHNGAVTTSGSGESAATGYGYDTTTADVNGVTTNTTDYRPNSVIYPNGRTIDYSYGTSGSQDDDLNRLESIVDASGNSSLDDATANDTLASYGYLGPDTIVSQDYNQPQITLSYAGSSSDSYPGLNQFGAVIAQDWKNSSGTTIDGYNYGYNLQGNVSYRQNLTADADSAALDQAFSYNTLGEVTALSQGTASITAGTSSAPASASISGTSLSQSFTLDSMGNWSQFSQSGTGVSTLSQTRITNKANQITAISTTTGTAWATPGYDADGNMTTTPQPGNESNGLTCTYDAWGRLTEVTGGGTTVHYAYDGLNRLIEEYNSGTHTQTDFYYAGQQQVESRVSSASSWAGAGHATDASAADVQYQYVWSPVYVNTPILRDTYSGGEMVGSSGAATSPGAAGRIYYLSDANANITAVTDPAANVLERYSYDTYGTVKVYNASWVATSGDASAMGNTVLFAGEQQDAATGLYYDRARWYSPSTGGFLSDDPAQADANLYRYAVDDPTSELDPTGLNVYPGNGLAGNTQENPPATPQPQGPTPTCDRQPSPDDTGAVPTGDDTAATDDDSAAANNDDNGEEDENSEEGAAGNDGAVGAKGADGEEEVTEDEEDGEGPADKTDAAHAGMIKLWMGDTRDSRAGLNPFYRTNEGKENVWFGVVGCGSYGPGGTQPGSLPAIPANQQILDLPDCGGPNGLLSYAEAPDAAKKALQAAKALKAKLSRDKSIKVTISIRLTKTYMNVLKSTDEGHNVLRELNPYMRQ